MQPQGHPSPGDSTWAKKWLEGNVYMQEKAGAGQQGHGLGQLCLRAAGLRAVEVVLRR